jgi:chromate transporter
VQVLRRQRKPVGPVVAIVAQAVWRVGRRSLTHPALIALAVASFAALALFAVPFPLVVVAAAVIGWLLARLAPRGPCARPPRTLPTTVRRR